MTTPNAANGWRQAGRQTGSHCSTDTNTRARTRTLYTSSSSSQTQTTTTRDRRRRRVSRWTYTHTHTHYQDELRKHKPIETRPIDHNRLTGRLLSRSTCNSLSLKKKKKTPTTTSLRWGSRVIATMTSLTHAHQKLDAKNTPTTVPYHRLSFFD